MLSIAPVNAATASHYYELDDYYAKDVQPGSEWYGKGTESLGLAGAVQKEIFVSLLEGKLPNGQRLGRMREEGIEHRAGLDLTFSAPKSVSILAELGADNRIFAVHEKAVKVALDQLEKNSIQTRVRKDSDIQFVNTNALVAALFQHDTSRNLDPQLHTHCVVMNATQTEDKQWRSLSNEQIYDTKMTVGALYRAQLACELTRLGYTLEIKKDALFEIKDVPQSLIEAMSTRRQEIEAAIEKFGLKGAKGAAKATLNTRKSKQAIEREALKPTWQAISKEHGFQPELLVPQKPSITKKGASVEEIAKASVLSAGQHLTERESQFTWGELMRQASQYALGKVDVSTLEKIFSSQLRRKAFVVVEDKGRRGEQRYTTQEQLLRETEVRLLMQQSKNTYQPLLLEETAHAALKTGTLNAQQYQAAFGTLTNTDKIVGIQGYAGVGKTHLLRAVQEAAISQSHTLIGLSPSAAAANELQRSAGIAADTVDAFLLNPKSHLSEKTHDKTQTMLIVDEASLLSTQKLLDLMRAAKAYDLRMVLVGDIQQLQSIEAGKPFAELQKAGMQTWTVDTIVRQKDEILKAAVIDTIRQDIQAAFEKIGDRIIEIDAKDVHTQAAQHWLRLSPEERTKTAVIVPDVVGRKRLNEEIRAGLKFSGDSITTKILVNRGLTREQKAHAKHYQVCDVVLFNKRYKSIGVKKGEYYRVSQIDLEANKLQLQSRGGETVEWQPHRLAARRAGIVEVYSPETRELQVGDKIRWSKNHKTEGRINTEQATVTVIGEKTMAVKLFDGTEKSLDLTQSKHQHWDYAYAHTAYAMQGTTVDRVIALLNSRQTLLTNPRTFYVEISRARHEVYLYVNDKAKVIEQLQKITGEKSSALNITPELQPGKLPTPQDTMPIEAKLNQAWTKIFEPRENVWERAKSLIGFGKPIETWKTREASVPWYVGEGMKDLGGQAVVFTTPKTPGHKTPTIKKDFELTI